jgi:hypothetical protein
MNIVYITYDKNLQKHFANSGIKALLTGLSVNEPHGQFYVYDRTNPNVNKILEKWYAGDNC